MRFDKSLFSGSEYVSYNGRFVARFKYNRGARGGFLTFLAKNFTVEEYFARLDAGELPLKILESKGYLLPFIKKVLKKAGYPTTPDGAHRYIKDQVEAQAAMRALDEALAS